MYYTQSRTTPVDLSYSTHRGTYDNTTGTVVFNDTVTPNKFDSEVALVYSYRSKRPRHAAASPVYGENLIKRGPSINGYIASYRAAVNALQTEAESTASSSGKSGRGDYDSGHSFFVRKTPVKTGTVSCMLPRSAYGPNNRDILWNDVYTGSYYVSPRSSLRLDNIGVGGSVDTATANAVQRVASATVPDRIHGSLGQDLVDLAQLPKFVSSLTRMARDLPALAERWGRLTHRTRAAIDYAFRHPGKASKAATAKAGSGYLEWLFVLRPYVDDMRLIADYLCKGSASLLARESFTRNVPISEWSDVEHSGTHSVSRGIASVRREVSGVRTAHVAVGWMAKGVTPSDEYFLTKARSLNRALGLWYPSLIWDLTPWTWLLDWCLHFGDMIDNVDAIQRSGYYPIYSWATIRETVVVNYKLEPYFVGSRIDGPNLSGSVGGTALARYPFSVDGIQLPSWNGLTASQRSIITALGFSHL